MICVHINFVYYMCLYSVMFITPILIINLTIQKNKVDEVVQVPWPPRRIQVMYEIQYNKNCTTKSPPKPLRIMTTKGTSGQEIMEIAANYNKRYRFTAKYFNNELGYSVEKIDDVEKGKNGCYWFLYVGTRYGVSLSPVGITNWIPFPNSKIIWRYSKYVQH